MNTTANASLRARARCYYPVFSRGGFKFCVLSATGEVKLLLYKSADAEEPSSTISMHGTYDSALAADRWSVRVKVPDQETVLYYRYLVNGEEILDPSALEVTGDIEWHGDQVVLPKCVARKSNAEKNKTRKPRIPMSRTIVYELNLHLFTAGGYNGIAPEIGYLSELCTTIEAMPVAQGDANDVGRTNPFTGEQLTNAWRYNTVLNNAVSTDAATSRATAVAEFKRMVRTIHDNGSELIVDLVYNHTSEGNDQGPVLHFKALGRDRYYVVRDGYMVQDHTGCGNEINANDPMVVEMILSSLRYWYNIIGVDGVRFDLFAVLMQNPELLGRIINDRKLRGMKLFPEPWATGGLYRVGDCGSGTAEWNDNYRGTVRDWVRGEWGKAGAFLEAATGSQGTFASWLDHWSVNFVTCHDGFTLEDLVSYNRKHNEANSWDNTDGINDNRSSNCGPTNEHGDPDDRFDGPLDPTVPWLTESQIAQILSLPKEERVRVLAYRRRQKRNFLTALLLSKGVPLLLSGDELGLTMRGNNNAYCQPDLCRMPWDNLEVPEHKALLSFVQGLVQLRRAVDINDCDVDRHGTTPYWADDSSGSRFVAIGYRPRNGSTSHLYWASNAHDSDLMVTLPVPPPGTQWHCVLDTAQGYDLAVAGAEPVGDKVVVEGRSNLVLISR